MIYLSAFADEISPDLDEQIAVLKSENIHYLDLRGVWGVNVLELSDKQVDEIKHALKASGIGVAAIGSPIGKVSIDSPFEAHLERFERAITLAQAFSTRLIRIFSFYPPSTRQVSFDELAEYRPEVMRRMQALIARARAADILLLHENEKDIYGDTIARCVDLLQSCNDVHFQAILDPANYIQCQQVPYPDAYEAIFPWLRYIHVKDVDAQGQLVAAGEGLAHWPELLQRLRKDGYAGFLTLEPHLAAAGQFQGFSGPDLFRHASQSLQRLLRAMDWQYE